MVTDPIAALEELAAAAAEQAALLRANPVPGSAPASQVSASLRRMTRAIESLPAARPTINHLLLGRHL
jgi:hypothetical protein